MKGYLLLFCGVLCAGYSQAQTEQQVIQQWQNAHPATQFVSEERYATLSKSERDLLGDDIIVYKDQITLSLLEAYDQQSKSTETIEEASISLEHKQLIKNWLATNPDVKIVPRSVFDTADESRRLVYSENPRCLVLEGENLTVKDIERFEH